MVDNGYGIWSAFANDEFLERLRLNHRALAVEWTIGPESVARTRHDRRLLAGHRGMRPGPWIRKAAPTARYAAFSDPDGNGWLLQKITERLPGRE